MKINNAVDALKAVKAGQEAAAYLKASAQGQVNADGVIIAEAVKEGEDVDARAISGSFKTYTYVTKYEASCKKMVAFGEVVVTMEAKRKAIETTAKKADKALPAPVAA